MGYLALTAFLSEAIAARENIPDDQKTPEYWAERLSIEWSTMGHKDLERKLLPFFREFDRLSSAADKGSLVQSTEMLADGQSDHLVDDNAALRYRVAELETRLEVDHAWRFEGDSEKPVRFEIPPEERATFPDGITARDATISLQYERIKEQSARIAELEAALINEKTLHRLANTMRFQQEDRDAARIAELRAALRPFDEAFDHLPEYALAHDPQCIWDTDAAQKIKVADLRRARSALNAASGGSGGPLRSEGTDAT